MWVKGPATLRTINPGRKENLINEMLTPLVGILTIDYLMSKSPLEQSAFHCL